MKLASLWRMLILSIIIIIIIGGTIIIIIVRGPILPDPPPCLVCGLNGLKYLGIAEALLGIISLGLISKIRNSEKF
ncbi:MAG: hypothetical protein ACKOU7_04540 [Ferruginibacter sp.]